MRNARAVSLAVAAVSVIQASCAQQPSETQAPKPDVTFSVEGERSSPWERGPSVRLTYPFALGVSNMTLNPMTSYTALFYDGGRDDRFELGAQLRVPVGQSTTTPSFWIGAEAAYAFLVDHFDDESESYSGWSLSALAGVPLTRGPLNPQVVAGAGINKYGSGGGTGKNIRIGVSITPF